MVVKLIKITLFQITVLTEQKHGSFELKRPISHCFIGKVWLFSEACRIRKYSFTIRGKKTKYIEFLNVKGSGAYSYHDALKGYECST